MKNLINFKNVINAFKNFKDQYPFDHCVIDNFFYPEIAKKLENEFPSFENPNLHEYNNPLEIKKISNNWNLFPATTYFVFSILNSRSFLSNLKKLTGINSLWADLGLNGGGWHIHKSGGKLNPHLDYSLHPKLGLQRKINLLIYLNSSWKEEWGGKLTLWEQDKNERKPGPLAKEITPYFNRAVFFDTTQNSWHGLPEPINCPKNQLRKSIAIYYLTIPPENTDIRKKTLYAPTKEQENNKEILDFIQRRSSIDTPHSHYMMNSYVKN